MKEDIDQDIAYWAELCEDTSAMEMKKHNKCLDEAYDAPYEYDINEGAPQIITVKDLKNALSHFNDNDVLKILKSNDEELDIKCIWNSGMEQEITGIVCDDNICFIRLD